MQETFPHRLALLLSLRRLACGCVAARPCALCSARALDARAGREPGHARQIAGGTYRTAQLDVVQAYAEAIGVEPAWLAFGAGPAFAAHPNVDPARDTERAAELLRASLGAPPAPLPAAPPPPRRRPQRLPPRPPARNRARRGVRVTAVEAQA